MCGVSAVGGALIAMDRANAPSAWATSQPHPETHQVLEPRGLSRTEAASYVGVSSSLFDQLVADGRMPKPKRINSRTVWDRRRLDDAFENLPGEADTNPWDQTGAFGGTLR